MRGKIKSKIELIQWLEKMKIQNYTINENLIVDVKNDVNLVEKNLKFFPFQFGKIEGDFLCNENVLKSLEGAPFEVKGTFDCSHNKLKNLDFAPKVVHKLKCSFNPIQIIKPLEISLNSFIHVCQENQIKLFMKNYIPYSTKLLNLFLLELNQSLFDEKMTQLKAIMEKETFKSQVNHYNKIETKKIKL